MLIIGAPGEVDYYLGSLAADQSGPGAWMGAGAASPRLTGTPTAGQLRQLLHGLDPETGQPRWASAARRRRLGHDLVFASPKSISLIAALGRPEMAAAVVAAHDAAVGDAFAYLDRQAAWARRGAEGRLVATDGLIAAGFRHRTSRAADPHLHTHVLVANAVRDRSGKWSSLDGRWLFAEARAAGALYQSALRYYTTAAGLTLTWRLRDDGLGDVVEVPPEAVREFSRRSRQIEARLAAWNQHQPPSRRSQRAAQLATRPAKHPDQRGTEAWPARARRTGFDASAITLQARPDQARQPRHSLLDTDAVDDMLGPHGLTARTSFFTRADLVRSVAARLTHGAPVADVEAEVERLLASPAVVRVTPDSAQQERPHSTPRYTTPEMVALEDRIIAHATPQTTWSRPAATSADHIAATLSARPNISSTQSAAVVDLVSSSQTVTVLRGTSRTGLATSAVLEAARSVWEASGWSVIAIAPSMRSAVALEATTGIEPAAAEPDHPTARVIVVEGADRIGSRVLADLVSRAKRSGQRVVLVDQGRCPAVVKGRELLSRLHAVVGRPALLVEGLPAGPTRTTPVARIVRPAGTVTFTHDPDSQRQVMVDDWSRRPEAGQMIATSLEEVDDLNRRARQRLLADGRIRGPCVDAGGREYRASEPVVVRRSAPALRLVAGQTGRVSTVDPERRTLTVDFAGRRHPVVISATAVGRTVLAHAYAVPPRHRSRATKTFVLGVGGGGGGRTHHYLVAATGPVNTREPVAPIDADLGQLQRSRDALAKELRSTRPADTATALRGAREELAAAAHWASAGPGAPWTSTRVDQAQRAVAQLEDQAATFAAWSEQHGPELDRQAAFERAIDTRRHLLGRAAEVLPDPELIALIGPPGGGPDRRAWREAAAAFEAHKERGGIEPHGIALDEVARKREHRWEVGIGLR